MADVRGRERWRAFAPRPRDDMTRKDTWWIACRLPLLFVLDAAFNGSLLSLLVAAVSPKPLPSSLFTKMLLSVDRESIFSGLLDDVSPERSMFCLFLYFTALMVAASAMLVSTRLLLLLYHGLVCLSCCILASQFVIWSPTNFSYSGKNDGLENLWQNRKFGAPCVYFVLLVNLVVTGPYLRAKRRMVLSFLASLGVCSILADSASLAVFSLAMSLALLSGLAVLNFLMVFPFLCARFRHDMSPWFRLNNENRLDFSFIQRMCSRLPLSRLFVIFFIIRVGLLAMSALYCANSSLQKDNFGGLNVLDNSGSRLVLLPAYVIVYRYVLIRSSETFISLWGLCAFISVLSDTMISVMTRFVGESTRHDESNGGFVMSVVFCLLCLEVDLSMQPPALRLFLLYRNCLLIGIGIMRTVEGDLHNALLRLSTTGKRAWSLYVRCYLTAVAFLVTPFLVIKFVWLPETKNPWHTAAVICGTELFCKTVISLIIHGVYLYHGRKKSEDQYAVEEIVFWIQECATGIQIFFSTLMFFNGAWLLLFASDVITRGLLMVLHAYISIWLPAKAAISSLNSHLAAKAKFNLLTDASVDQLRELDDVCAICCAAFEDHGKVTPCKHIFHASCLRTWLELRNFCPICLRTVFTAEMETR